MITVGYLTLYMQSLALRTRRETTSSLRTGSHQKLLIPKTSDLADRHFIIRSLYKNLYWCDFTHFGVSVVYPMSLPTTIRAATYTIVCEFG